MFDVILMNFMNICNINIGYSFAFIFIKMQYILAVHLKLCVLYFSKPMLFIKPVNAIVIKNLLTNP